MKLQIPIYVETWRKTYTVRPLFFPAASAQAEVLSRALTKLATAVREELDRCGKESRHDVLAACTFEPDLSHQHVQVTLQAKKHMVRLRLLVVTLEALDRRIAHVPAYPELWFEVARGDKLQTRVEEVLERHLRDRLRDDESFPQSAPKAWIATLEVAFKPPPEWAPPEAVSLLALLGGGGPLDGTRELRGVGRRLDDLYPDDLERSIRRDLDVKRLLRALDLPQRRPVLVRGPRRVGKTALVHEAVYRRNEERKKPGGDHSVWAIAPQRLISGMSYVGQWESRLVAILDTAKKRDHVLYFDDLLGLYAAGQSACSDLSVADVLKPYVERRDVRILGEITPAAFRVLQERDRGFADMFEVVPLEETNLPDTLRIVLDLVRRAEMRQACRFSPQSLGLVVDLQRRYVRDAAFPGKACTFASHLAARYAEKDISGDDVLHEFHLLSGLSLQMLDVHSRLQRDDVVRALRADVVGQDDAVAAMADAVSVAKARISDPSRPLASLLFLGPTGVGKTQCARALAKFLFGDESRMVRFDMNEFITPDAVSRLCGTFADPGGLLTSAVRRTPFCVLLLDEIEKAHPDVFNLLLQVLGDGRLTDARGNTVDFTHAIVILTSNLGVREVGRPLGFRTDVGQDALVYRRAAEQFFAPELFNRLDRIVPFARLARSDVEIIARSLMSRVLSREGLLRRQCILQVDRRAFDAIVEEGYHPLLGARALKRAVERHVAQPIAARLAAMVPSGVAVVALFAMRDGVTALVQPLRQAVRQAAHARDGVEARIAALEQAAERLSPSGPVDSERLALAQMQYFMLRQGIERARLLLKKVSSKPEKRPSGPPKPVRKPATTRRALLRTAADFTGLLQSGDVRTALRAAADSAPAMTPSAGQIDAAALTSALMRDLSLLEAIAAADAEEEALVWIRGLDDGSPALLEALSRSYNAAAEDGLELEAALLDATVTERALTVRGVAAWRLLHGEHGTHLFVDGEVLLPVSVVVQRVAMGTSQASLEALRAGRAQWLEALARGEASVYEAPHPLADVLRVYGEHVVDLRSGAVVDGMPGGPEMRELILGGLP